MKKNLNTFEMIELLESRYIKFNNDVERSEMCAYLDKYNYVMVINPYKILHATNIVI